MVRSIAKMASLRVTASTAIGALLSAAISWNLCRQCAQHPASRIVPGKRPGSYNLLKPA